MDPISFDNIDTENPRRLIRALEIYRETGQTFSSFKSNTKHGKFPFILIGLEINREELRKYPESIFIVGMPRSGSTLLESILSLRNDVHDLGEVNILEESLLEWKTSKQDRNLAEIYWGKVNQKTELNITTNKWLFNYQYAGIIASRIPNAKIIHCY